MAVLFSFLPSDSKSLNLQSAKLTLKSSLQELKILSLSDSYIFTQLDSAKLYAKSLPSIESIRLLDEGRNAMWQMQFHLGRIYTTSSFSIYIDTPRNAKTTDFDGRPMAGDIVYKDINAICLSGYNNTNTSIECKNNTHAKVRLKERFGIDSLFIQADSYCLEGETSRIYFDSVGKPHCGKNPTPLTMPYKITLQKDKLQQSICILPINGRILEC